MASDGTTGSYSATRRATWTTTGNIYTCMCIYIYINVCTYMYVCYIYMFLYTHTPIYIDCKYILYIIYICSI